MDLLTEKKPIRMILRDIKVLIGKATTRSMKDPRSPEHSKVLISNQKLHDRREILPIRAPDPRKLSF